MNVFKIEQSVWTVLFLSLLMASTAMAQSGQSSAISSPRPVHQVSELKPHVGVRGGLATPDDRYDSTVGLGVDVGFQPYVPFGLGVEYMNYASTDRERSNNSLERSKVMLKGTYGFGGTNPAIRYSYIGTGVGAVFDSIEGQTKQTQWGIEPLVGFDYPITSDSIDYRVTVGATASYLFVSSNNPEQFGLDAIAKYWF